MFTVQWVRCSSTVFWISKMLKALQGLFASVYTALGIETTEESCDMKCVSSFFSAEVDPNSGLLAIALYLLFKFIGGSLGVQLSCQGPRFRSALPLLFVLDPSWQSPKVCILNFFNNSHSRRMCTDISISAPHLLHEGVFALLILCSMYCRLICPVRRATNILKCFLSSLLMN